MSFIRRARAGLETLIWLAMLGAIVSGLLLGETRSDPGSVWTDSESLWMMRQAHLWSTTLLFAAVYAFILLHFGAEPHDRRERAVASAVGLVAAIAVASAFLAAMVSTDPLTSWLAARSGLDPHAAAGAAMLLALAATQTVRRWRLARRRDLVAAILLIILLVGVWLALRGAAAPAPPNNAAPSSVLSTPAHIVPEWWTWPFYAVLRAIPDKTLGFAALGVALLGLIIAPWLSFGATRSGSAISWARRLSFAGFTLCAIGLTLLGPVDPGRALGGAVSVQAVSLGLTVYALGYLFLVRPLLSLAALAFPTPGQPHPDVFA